MISKTTNIEIIRSALLARGFSDEDITLGGRPFTRFSKDNEVRWLTYHDPALAYPATHNAIREISRNKTLATEYIESLGYSVPKSITVVDRTHIEDAQAMIGLAPLIIKPEFGSLSRGVKRNIASRDELYHDVEHILSDGDHCVVQQQVMGEEIRFVCIGKKLRAAILRKRPFVTGDGVHDIGQLVDIENQLRRDITDSAVAYPQLSEDMLTMDGLDTKYVPNDGEEVAIGYGTMIRDGASILDVTDDIHPQYRSMVERIAESLNAQFLAIDVIVRDWSVFDDYWFIEFNTSPVLKLFYSCRDGKHFDAGRFLAEMVDNVTTTRVAGVEERT